MVRCSRRFALGIILLLVVMAGSGLAVLGGASDARAEGMPSPEPSVVRELVERRTEYSLTYLLSSGAYRCVMYQSPINYQGADGTWQSIDTSLIPQGMGVYSTTACPMKVTVADEAPGQKPVSVQVRGYTLTMNLQGWGEDGKIVVGDTAVYPEVAPDTDLCYEVLGDWLKETITLETPAAPNAFTFRLLHPGLTLAQDPTGGWGLYSPGASEPVIRLGAVGACDSSIDEAGNPVWCDGAKMAAIAGEGASTVTYSVPRSWLEDPARVYPVMIDPSPLDSRNPTDIYISAGHPNTAYGTADPQNLLCGVVSTDMGRCQALVKFPLINNTMSASNPGAIPRGATVTSATFSIRQFWQPSSPSNKTHFYRIGTGSTNWDENETKNSITLVGSTEIGNGLSSTAENYWFNLSCASTVQSWINDRDNGVVLYNRGIAIRQESDEGASFARKFRSGEYGNVDYRPKIHVEYAPPMATSISPAGSVEKGSTPNVSWNFPSICNSGSFSVFLTDASGAVLDTLATGVSASGSGSYSCSWNVTQGISSGSSRKLKVSYYDAGGYPISEQSYSGPFDIVDTTAPTTTASGADSAWHASPVTLGFTADDHNGSGVNHIEYKIDSGSWTSGTTVTVPAPADHANDGDHLVYYRAIDNAGNFPLSPPSVHVKIDTTAPTTTASGADSAWHASAVTVGFTASDGSGSGVNHIEYKVDSGSWTTGSSVTVSTDGDHLVYYRAVDNVGNAPASPPSVHVKIDTTAPTTTATGLQADDHSGWRTSAQMVSLTAADGASGVANIYFKVDGGAQQTYTAAFDVSGAGQHRVEYWSVDALGNAESHRTGYVNIGPAAPVVTAPNGGETYIAGSSSTSVTWQGVNPTGWGCYSVWTVAVSDGTQQMVGVVDAVVGQSAYSLPWTVDSGAGNYRVRIAWGVTHSGPWQIYDESDASFTVQPFLTITAPASSVSVARDTTMAIGWSAPQAPGSGVYRVRAVPDSGGEGALLGLLPAVNGQTSFGLDWSVTQATGTYRIEVAFGQSAGRWSFVATSPVVTVTSSQSAVVPNAMGTKILFCRGSMNTYSFTPPVPGELSVDIGWSRSGQSDAPVFPAASVGLVVQTADATTGESYLPLEATAGTANPTNVLLSVTSSGANDSVQAGRPVYFSVRPRVGRCDYVLNVSYTHDGQTTTVISECGSAAGSAGDVYLDWPGSLHSVLQTWPGASGDARVNWDASLAQRTGGTAELLRDAAVSWSQGSALDLTIPASGFQPLWLVANPFPAESAASPNVWGRSEDLFPQPGSLADGTGDAWYTLSYPVSEQATAADGWSGWSQAKSYPVGYALASAPASQSSSGSASWADSGSLSTSGAVARDENEQSPAIYYRFFGESCTWKYTTTAQSGIVDLYVDGVQAATVDQYSSTAQYGQQTTLNGFSDNAWHTVQVAPSGEKNAASGGYLFSHDAFVARTDSDDVELISEDNTDGATFYSWATSNSTTAHGGAFTYSSNIGAATAFTFSGDAVTWQYGSGPNCGIASIFIDGANKGQIDQYAAQLTVDSSRRVSFQGLGPGLHTMLITASTEKNAASSGNYIISDEFESIDPATGLPKHTEAELPPPVQLKSDVVVLDDATVNGITSFPADDANGQSIMTFSSATPQLQAIRADHTSGRNDVLIVNKCAAYPHGIARRVISFPSATQVQTRAIVSADLYVNDRVPKASFDVTDQMIVDARANGGTLVGDGWTVSVSSVGSTSTGSVPWSPVYDGYLQGVGGEVRVSGDFYAGNFHGSFFGAGENRGDIACDNLSFTALGNVTFTEPVKYRYIDGVESWWNTDKLPVVVTGDSKPKVIKLSIDLGERWDGYIRVYGRISSGSCVYLDGEILPQNGSDAFGLESFVWRPICAEYLTPALAAAASDTWPSGAPGGISLGQKAPTTLTENQQITGPALFTYAVGLQRTGVIGWSPDPFGILNVPGDVSWTAMERYCRLHCDYAATPKADIVTGVDWCGDEGTVLPVPGHEAALIWQSSTVTERFPVTTYAAANPVAPESYGEKLWLISDGSPNLVARDIKSDTPDSELVCPLRSCPTCGGLVLPYQTNYTCPLCAWRDPDPSGATGVFRISGPYAKHVDDDTVVWIEDSGPSDFGNEFPKKSEIYFRSLSSSMPETRIRPRAGDDDAAADWAKNVGVAARAHLIVAAGEPDNGASLYSDHNISGFRFSSDGSRGPQFLIRSTGAPYYDWPGPFVDYGSLDVCSVDDDTAFVMWREYYQDSLHAAQRDITWWGAFVHPSTGVVEPRIAVILPGQGDPVYGYDMGFADGKVTIVFENATQTNNTQIYGIDVDRSTGTTGSPYLISDDDYFSPRTLPVPLSMMTAFNPRIAVSGGQRVVLWDGHWKDDQDSEFHAIQAINLETHACINVSTGPDEFMSSTDVLGISGRSDAETPADARWRLLWTDDAGIHATPLRPTDF